MSPRPRASEEGKEHGGKETKDSRDSSKSPSPRSASSLSRESSVSPRDMGQRVLPLQRLQKASADQPKESSATFSSSPSPSQPPPLPRDLPKDVALRSWFIRANELRNSASATTSAISSASPVSSSSLTGLSSAAKEQQRRNSQRKSLGELEVMLDELSAGRSSEGGDELFEFSSETDFNLLQTEVTSSEGQAPPTRDFASFLLPIVRVPQPNLFDSSAKFDKFLRIVFGAENVAEHEEHWIVSRNAFNLVLAMSNAEVVMLLAMEDVSVHAATVREQLGPEVKRACNLVLFGKSL